MLVQEYPEAHLMSLTGHVLWGSSGETTLQILEGKFEAATAQGRPRRIGWMI